MKKILMFVLIVSTLTFSIENENDYKKVYIMNVPRKVLYTKINTNEKQQEKLDKIFKKYREEAKSVENDIAKYENKKEKIDEIEEKRYKDIANVLTSDQMNAFNNYINEQKSNYENKNDKIIKFVSNLNLTYEQKAEVLRYQRKFEREVNKELKRGSGSKDFISKYNELRLERNSKIDTVLNETQKELLNKNIKVY